MNWQDEKTAILKDTSIVNFNEDGSVELYPSVNWIKPRNKHKHGYGHCYRFKYETKQQAIDIFTELENQIANEKAN